MVKVEKATTAITPQILDLLMEFRAGHMTRDLWSRVLTCDWGQEEDYHGLVLTDEGHVVGFLGMFFSERTIRERRCRFCSLVGWIVRPDYRNHSLSLLAPLLKMRNYTITNLTSFEEGVEIMLRIGFRVLDAESLVILSMPSLASRKGWTVTEDAAELLRALSPADRKIFEDHQPYACRHLLLKGDGAPYCYVVYTERRRGCAKYAFAHYIGNPAAFAEHVGAVRNHLLRRGVIALLVDRRFTGLWRPAFSRVRKVPVPRLYRPADGVEPACVDTLYSEWTLLNR